MAKYIKQEMPDIAGKGENAVYYRMQTERNIGAAEFIEEVAGIGTGLSEGAVTHVFVSDPTQGYGLYVDWMLGESAAV